MAADTPMAYSTFAPTAERRGLRRGDGKPFFSYGFMLADYPGLIAAYWNYHPHYQPPPVKDALTRLIDQAGTTALQIPGASRAYGNELPGNGNRPPILLLLHKPPVNLLLRQRR